VRKGDRVVVWGRVRTEQWKGEDGGQRSDLAIEAEALGHDLAYGVAVFHRRHRTVSAQTLTPEGVVDMATGELRPASPADVSPLPAAAEQPVGVPGSTGPVPNPAESGDDDDLGDLDELDEEDPVDGAERGVTLLASA
jgi:single-strand DNA-binding protein